MYIANISPNARGPNTTYIPPARVGSVGARFGVGGLRVWSVGVRVGSWRIFRYQHIDIGNANRSRWGPYPTQSPKVSVFALQLSIGSELQP